MSILNLSLELLQEITDRIPADHGQLRVVCWTLNHAVARSFFSSVLLDVHSSRLEAGLSYLEALATGATPWSEFARNLTIKRLSPSLVVDPNEGHEEDQYQLQLAEARLENVLRSLPQLDFRLTTDESGFASNFDCSFERLTNLRTLTVTSSNEIYLAGVCRSLQNAVRNSPDLSFLHLGTDHAWGIPSRLSFADLFPDLAEPLRLTGLRMDRYNLRLDHSTIPHLRSLKSLQLFRVYPEIWDSLRQESIHLIEIHTDTIEESLLEYLSSYSGLEHLIIACAGGKSEVEANRRANEFFTNALPHHTRSLVALGCRGHWEGRWSFGMHNAGVLAQLQNLTSLCMNVNSILVEADVGPQDAESQRSGRALGVSVELESDSDGRNMVHRFLDLINQLPIIDAGIMPAEPRRSRGSRWGQDRAKHRELFVKEINAAVREFKSRDGHISAAVVQAVHQYYQMEGGEGRYCALQPNMLL
ncbi:hypothetical protein K438DRAFT_1984485 [Mycena galopus ATCC 62051]|nr:hypothetical protein K438DRAFT_2000237 [Mycena galopus ATCC 62051]KAF8166140.1 hypothetical protein K438DRAFT_1984485 [Mycena galopus ATCC 62051]